MKDLITKPERRTLDLPMTLQADGPTPNRLVGYAAKFNAESSPLFDFGPEGFVEVIAPGAFSRTLRENPDIRALYNHDTSIVLGRTKSGTLKLAEDATGLAFEVDLPDTQAARDVREMIRRGDISGCSFGFFTVEEDLKLREGLPMLRTLIDIELIEISPAVAFPAYDSSEVALRRRGQALPPSRTRLITARRTFDFTDAAL